MLFPETTVALLAELLNLPDLSCYVLTLLIKLRVAAGLGGSKRTDSSKLTPEIFLFSVEVILRSSLLEPCRCVLMLGMLVRGSVRPICAFGFCLLDFKYGSSLGRKALPVDTGETKFGLAGSLFESIGTGLESESSFSVLIWLRRNLMLGRFRDNF